MAFVQRDAPQVVRDLLRSRPWLEGIRVTSKTAITDDINAGPYISVASDGTPSGALATATENVRVVVYSKWEPEARSLATLIDGFLLDPKVHSGFRVMPGAPLMVIQDEQIKGYAAAITVRVAGTKKEMRL